MYIAFYNSPYYIGTALYRVSTGWLERIIQSAGIILSISAANQRWNNNVAPVIGLAHT